MKTSHLSGLLFVVLLIVCSSAVEGNKYKEPVTSTYTTTMNADQVVDGSNSGATGTGRFFYDAKSKTLSWTITHNVNNPLTADIHGPAKPGENAKGDAVVALPSATSPITGKAKLSKDEALDLMDDLLYIIIHTADNPLGEIRGQIILTSIEGIAKGEAKMNGDKIVPEPVDTKASGSFSFSFSNLTRVLTYRISHSVKNATAMHIHGPAPETENAGVLLTFPESDGSKLKGNFTLTAQQEEYLLNGLLYVAVHSTSNPAGEIRGQIEVTEISLSTGGSDDNSGLSGGEIFAIIFFVFVGLLVLAGVGYFLYRKRAEGSFSSSGQAASSNFYNSSSSSSTSSSSYRRQMGVSLLDDAQQV